MFIYANGFTEKELALAKALSLNIVQTKPPAYLAYTASGLHYISEDRKLHIDFLNPNLQSRLTPPRRLWSELILKACDAKRSRNILDTTAGLGEDAFLLAMSGVSVTALERSPILHALLVDAYSRLDRYQHDLNFKIVHADARSYLSDVPDFFDVIYIDPMHPLRRSAKVCQEMVLIRELVGDDNDWIELFKLARIRAKHRIVVKWPHKDPSPLPKPHFSYTGKRIRFDVYLPS